MNALAFIGCLALIALGIALIVGIVNLVIAVCNHGEKIERLQKDTREDRGDWRRDIWQLRERVEKLEGKQS